MASVNVRQIAEDMKESYICLDSYKNKNMQGCFWHVTLQRSVQFDNLMQLLLLIEQTLIDIEFPKPYTERRSFRKKNVPLPGGDGATAEVRLPRGKLATFRVKILFQQNASWQGSVTWLEDNNEESFRSTLELVFLLDSAAAAQYPAENDA